MFLVKNNQAGETSSVSESLDTVTTRENPSRHTEAFAPSPSLAPPTTRYGEPKENPCFYTARYNSFHRFNQGVQERIDALRPEPFYTDLDGRQYFLCLVEAAFFWSLKYNPLSVQSGNEFGSLIYKREIPINLSGLMGFYFGPTIQGNEQMVPIWDGFCCENCYLAGDSVLAGSIHSHGSRYEPRAYTEFSHRSVYTGSGDTSVAVILNDLIQLYNDYHGIEGCYLSTNFLVNSLGQLKQLQLTEEQYNSLPPYQSLSLDSDYVTLISEKIPTH